MTVELEKPAYPFSLSMTPLIDVVFQLLIFFLVAGAAEFAEQERQLRLLLPEASEAQPLTSKPSEMFINVNERGQYFVGGKTLTIDELDSALKMAWANNPGRASVIIRADRRCPWQYVVAAINACLKAKIRDYKVTAREPRE